MRKTVLALCLALASPALAAVSGTSSHQDYTAVGGVDFDFTFQVIEAGDVEVWVNGVEQSPTTYTLALTAKPVGATLYPGGKVTFNVAPANGAKVRIQRTIPLTQGLVLQPYSAFPARTIEKTFDRLVMQAQQLERDKGTLGRRACGVGQVLTSTDGSTLTCVNDNGSSPVADLSTAQASGGGPTKTLSDWFATGPVRADATTVAATGGPTKTLADWMRDGPIAMNGNASSASVAAVGGTTARTLAAMAADTTTITNHQGCVGNGATNCWPGIAEAAALVGTGGRVRVPYKAGASTFYFATWTASAVTTTLDVDEGVTLSVPSDAVFGGTDTLNLRLARPTRFYLRSADRYITLSPNHLRARADKRHWLDVPRERRPKATAVNASTGVQAVKIAHPTNSGFVADTFAASTAESFTITPGAADSTWHYGLVPAKKGDEVFASASVTGAPFLSIIVRTSKGLAGVFASVDDAVGSSLWMADAGAGYISTGTITWFEKGTQPSYSVAKSLLSVRVTGWGSFSICLNGVPIYSATVAASIYGVGFGILPNAPGDSVTFKQVSKLSNRDGVVGPIVLGVVGDSLSQRRYDAWSYYAAEAIDNVKGARVLNTINVAVAGEASGGAASHVLAGEVDGATHVLVLTGTNDIQSGNTVATYLSNLTALADYLAARGKIMIFGVPPLWYNQTQAPGGTPSVNAALGAEYRAALLRWCAGRGYPVVDLSEVTGPVTPTFLAGSVDPLLYDNLHPDSYLTQLVGRAFARGLVETLTARDTATWVEPLNPINGWVAGPGGAFAFAGEDGSVQFSGYLDRTQFATNVTDGTVVATVPPALTPIVTYRTPVAIQQEAGEIGSGYPFVEIDTAGAVKLYGWPKKTGAVAYGSPWLDLSAVSYQTGL